MLTCAQNKQIQVRLCLDRQDYVRAQILSRKISPRVFDADASKGKKKPKEGDNVVEEAPADIPSLLELKRIYYELMIRYICLLAKFVVITRSSGLLLLSYLQNILVVSKYYSRITLKRLADLLCLSLQWYSLHDYFLVELVPVLKQTGSLSLFQEAEKHLSDMVVSKALVAKIDRPIGIVSFQTAKDSNDILNSWAVNLEKLLDLVEKSCHQIHKETMVHKAVLRA
ncbi:hypothetical protein BHM03_00027183 [Ensete ventricosum]|nr:hypothetical protein BHM03_00027183 [Ensete ventricosum]